MLFQNVSRETFTPTSEKNGSIIYRVDGENPPTLF